MKTKFSARPFLLVAIVGYFIFQLGKDCANYDKRHNYSEIIKK